MYSDRRKNGFLLSAFAGTSFAGMIITAKGEYYG